MRDYFLFPIEGKTVKITKTVTKHIRIDMTGLGSATATADFEKQQLIQELNDLVKYLEKNG